MTTGRTLTTQGVAGVLRKAGELSWQQASRGWRVELLRNGDVRICVSGVSDGGELARLRRYADALRVAGYDAVVMGYAVIVQKGPIQ